jgi:hypothetical protein
MSTQTLKDNRNSTIGYIETRSDSTEVGKDALHRIVGNYDPKTNKTKDARHSNVGEGNLLSSLITNAR